MTLDELRSWLDSYGRAWEMRDANAAAALFTSEATYQWGPFEEPLRGREAIRKRWADATGAQETVSFAHEPLAVTEERGIARWWVSFVRPIQQKQVRLDGIFVLSLDADGLCRDFREWWNSEEEPLGEPSLSS